MIDFAYQQVPDAEAYLKRIGYTGDKAVCRENLNALIYRHQIAVPFESLDLSIYHRPIVLDTEKLFEKIVLRHRGGYCFELNGLFVSLLRTLGYDAVSVMCRLVCNGPELVPVAHRGCMVRMDGRRYFCDVGFGGAMAPFAVELSGERQTFYGETFWIEEGQEGWMYLMRLKKGGIGDLTDEPEQVMPMLYFVPTAFADMDFEAMNARASAPDSKFAARIWANHRTETGFERLIGSDWTQKKAGVLHQRTVTDAEIPAILREHFGLYEDV